VATPTLSTLLAAVLRAGLADALTDPGPLTLFAPTNNAFTTVPADIATLLFEEDEFIPHLRDLLIYHVLAGEFFAADLAASMPAALNGEEVTISLDPLRVNGIAVSDGDNDVSNGVVHIIDTGVLTPSWVSNTLADRANSESDLSTLGALLVAANVDLSAPGSFTLLAPTNDAFAALPQETVDFLTDPENVSDLVRVLAYHVLVGVFTSTELTPGPLPTFVAGAMVMVATDPVVTFNNAGVVKVDILARNGVLHKIDEVLEPPTLDTIIDFIEDTPELSTLLTALQRAGFTEGLRGPGPFTLFAPTNNAFDTVPADIASLLFEEDAFIFHLQDLLFYHLLNVELFAADFADGDILPALNEENVTVALTPLSVNGITISDGDNDVSNGVVHLVDAGVLTPSWVSNALADRVNSDSSLSTLGELLALANIDLSTAGGFTLLAPTNVAFAALPEGTLDFLRDPANVAALRQVLAYHLLPGVVNSQLLVDGQQLTTFESRPVLVALDPIMFNNAGVVEVDILAKNGVLHKIDAVLDFALRVIDLVAMEPSLAGLLIALQRAGFANALAGRGPLTLFAPTDNALSQLPAYILGLLFSNDAFIPHLREFLLYHLLNVKLFAADFTEGQILTTLSTENVTITLAPVRVNEIEVSQPDNDAINGVVHIINATALSPSWVTNSAADRVSSTSELSTLGALLASAGIDLSQEGAITLLAPTNDAFAAVPQETLDFLTNPNNVADLVTLLSYHVIPGVFTLDRLSAGQQLPTFEGRAIAVNANPL
jgi:uncharacterized surface protein with fasciclin (FAS1) repeats